MAEEHDGRGERGRRPGQLLEGTVADPAIDPASGFLRVELDAERGAVQSCRWMPRSDGREPVPGDAASVVESDAGNHWVVGWWPAETEAWSLQTPSLQVPSLTSQEIVRVQGAEGEVVPILRVVPATPGAAPFQIQMNSYPNLGEGEGHNHGVWFGWNAARFSGGDWTVGRPGVYMGFEDNYYDDPGDDTYGVEWYVGYTTPDGQTIGPGDLRPFYFRVKASDTNTADKEVIAWVDVGGGDSGSFSVMGDVLDQTQLFVVHKSLGIFNRLPAYFTAAPSLNGHQPSLVVNPTTDYAQIDLVAPGTGTGGAYSVLAFKHVDTYRWTIAATTGAFSVQDSTNANRRHIELTPGTSDKTAVTTLRSNLAVAGKFGANGADVQDRYPAIAAPTTGTVVDAEARAAINSIRQVLYNFGLTH